MCRTWSFADKHRINEILVMKIVELGKIEGDPERLGEKVLAYYHSR